VWRGGLGKVYRFPALSSAGASLTRPCFRFHTPLIELDVRISRFQLSEKGSRCRPRETARSLGKTYEAKHFVQACLRKSLGRRPHPFVLGTQPLTQPLAGGLFHRLIGFADGPETEVVGPPNHRAVELRYYYRRIQQGLIPSGHLADRLADADHPLLRGKRTYVRAPCLRRIASTKRNPRKSNFSSGSLQTRVFVSFTVSFNLVMMSRIGQRFFRLPPLLL
jgi:hypothetical protein